MTLAQTTDLCSASDAFAAQSLYCNRSRLLIDTSQILKNVRTLKALLPSTTVIVAVLKANAYGHGAKVISKILCSAGVDYLAVGTPSEAVILREQGVSCSIMVLSGLLPSEFSAILRYRLVPVVHDMDTLRALDRFATRHKSLIAIHVEVDTGMSRLGIPARTPICPLLLSSRYLTVEGLMTHLASGDRPRSRLTAKQVKEFLNVISEFRRAGIAPTYTHCASTAAVLSGCHPRQCNMVRVGRGILGLLSDSELKVTHSDILPVLSWRAIVVSVRTIHAGTRVGYGGSFRAKRRMQVATVSVGYADGMPRWSGKGAHVLVGRTPCRIIGEVSMGLLTVDSSPASHLKPGDEIALIENRAPARIQDLARTATTVPAELTCHFPASIERVYQ